MTIDIRKLMRDGNESIAKEFAGAEAGKLGRYRVGNTGAIIHGNQPVGSCPRIAHLRSLGIQTERAPGESRELMFEAGRTNEDAWLRVLKAGAPIGVTFKCEEEIPVDYELEGVGRITGRPDIVALENGVPQKGIELKLASSLWTARDVGFELKPKLVHLLQAGHYAKKLDIPFELWYASRVDWPVMGFAVGLFPKFSPDLDDRVDYGYYKKLPPAFNPRTGRTEAKTVAVTPEEYARTPEAERTREIKKLYPFTQGYELKWNERGQLEWRVLPPVGLPTSKAVAMVGAWHLSPVTWDGIESFYQAAADPAKLLTTKRPIILKADGAPGSYSPCDYCALRTTCEKFDSQGKVFRGKADKLSSSRTPDYEAWLAEVVRVTAEFQNAGPGFEE